jgi:hypothetical protein
MIGEKSAERKCFQRRFFMSRVNPRPTRLADMLRLSYAGSGREAASRKATERRGAALWGKSV